MMGDKNPVEYETLSQGKACLSLGIYICRRLVLQPQLVFEVLVALITAYTATNNISYRNEIAQLLGSKLLSQPM